MQITKRYELTRRERAHMKQLRQVQTEKPTPADYCPADA